MLPVFIVLPYTGIIRLWFEWFEFVILPVEWSSLSLSNISSAAVGSVLFTVDVDW